jgi:hypothetical protein
LHENPCGTLVPGIVQRGINNILIVMGNSGSYTSKADIDTNLFVFTKWGTPEIREFLARGQHELPETFALRRHEFEFLLGQEMVDFTTSRTIFNDIFDLDRNQLVDKFEVMCVVCLISKCDNQEKIHFFFDLFNFNNKGYLFESELMLLLLAVSRGVFKADQKYLPPNNKTIALLVKEAFHHHAKVEKGSLRKPELVNFALGNPEILAFLESWRGHASQVRMTKFAGASLFGGFALNSFFIQQTPGFARYRR